jgi:GT2 family glycosyltransferase
VIACIFGGKFKAVYPSVKDYDSYLFTNNPEIKETVEKAGWKYIFIDFPLSDDDAVSSFQSKYIKFLQFLKEESFSYFKNYDKIIITDHKLELKDEHVKYLLKLMGDKKILVRDHTLNRRNIWEEVGDAMFQERYLRFMPQTIDYIREKIAEGFSEQPVVVWTSLMVYSHLDTAVMEFLDKIYNDLVKIGTSECQIIWAMLGQKYTDIIKIIKWNTLDIKWEEPKEVKEENKTGNMEESEGKERFLMRELKNKIGHIEQLINNERTLRGELQKRTDLFLKNELRLKGELNNKTLHVEQLLQNERKLNAEIVTILSSRSWKIASKISAFSNMLLPKNSKRRLFVKSIVHFIKNPYEYISKRHNVSDNEIPQDTKKSYVTINGNLIKEINDYETVVFKEESNPLVTIIIPVYNQFDYTYNCLKSILYNSGDKVNYEIIIADDCSNDLTAEIDKIVINIKVVKTRENLGFLKNCNYAAKHAKGEYILFLNNDTQVQDNWLLPLVDLIESNDSIGAVGSKLIFDNGLLQEAGGIYWKDATAWNYGRMSDPEQSEFNYVKEVDYISGAALMIKKSIWEDLGGFDEVFAPAYCEDADICFSIRKRGYKVMYQPASVVVHFEGISNGTDISEGLKQYQVKNQKKFFEKWNDVLVSEHFPNGDNIFHARDRSCGKKTLLMVDHYVPTFDKDAGSRSVFQYLKLFVNMGFNVKFIGDNFYKNEPYTGILEQMGIEVLYGDYYSQNWKIWLSANGKYIDYAILSRPHIAVRYIDELRDKTNAKIIYFGHDLHFLRETREYATTKNNELIKYIQMWKEVELSLMKKSDVVYYFSTLEVNLIKEIDPQINCKIVPLHIYQKRDLRTYNHTRKDLLFVGGFKHNPNVDSLIWFIKEIFPMIKNEISGIVLYVIGSNVKEEIKMLERQDTVILGYVKDEILEEYYRNCKICVAPLRFGAGVKGKVLEAMYNQIPLITTAIGAEGLPEIEDCIIIEDNEENFARKIIDAYNNKELLKNMEVNSFNYIMNNFTVDKVDDILKEDFV